MTSQCSSSVPGLELYRWRQSAKERAIKEEIPPREVDWLLREITDLEPLVLRLESFKDKPQIYLKISLKELEELWQQRLEERIPLQYLTGVAYWRNFALKVTPAVLIPRPETEDLIDLAIAARSSSTPAENENWADLGTGSGAIALGLAEALTEAKIYAIDSSSEALAVARENAEKCGLAHRIEFARGYWWEPLDKLKGQISGMVANPPYIPSRAIAALQPEVVKHEPHLALDGGIDGLDCIKYLIETAPTYLRSGGVWLIEMMAGQASAVAELLRSNGNYTQIQIFSDLAGIERFALARRV